MNYYKLIMNTTVIGSGFIVYLLLFRIRRINIFFNIKLRILVRKMRL